jgi:hypothetical protein
MICISLARWLAVAFVLMASMKSIAADAKLELQEAPGSGTLRLGTNTMLLRPATGCVAHKTNDVLVLSGDGPLLSEPTFAPPFTLRAIARTDVTNIRLYWGTGMVIFNWELNPRELRFHDPEAGRPHAFGGRGFLTVNEWHEIEWVVNPDSSYVIVDGEQRAFVRSNNSRLTNAVGISASRGSIVTVKELEVQKVGRSAER